MSTERERAAEERERLCAWLEEIATPRTIVRFRRIQALLRSEPPEGERIAVGVRPDALRVLRNGGSATIGGTPDYGRKLRATLIVEAKP